MVSLLVSGSLLAAAPLLAAAIWTGITLNQLIVQGEQLVQNGVALERLGGELHDQVNALERNARQYAALGDTKLLGVIRNRLQNAVDTSGKLGKLSYRESLSGGLDQAVAGLLLAQQDWNAKPPADAAALEAAIASFQVMGEQVRTALVAGRTAVDADVAAMREMSDTARWMMWSCSAALVLLAAVMAVLISTVIARPMKRMSLGIAALGHARYNQPIRIGYPEEMRRLGELLDWLRRKLAQLETDKNVFLRNVSHELKTPIATLKEGIALLRDGSLGLINPRQIEVTRILSDASDDLVKRVSGLLEYAAWRDARDRERGDWFDVQALFEAALSSQRLPMEARQLTAELELLAPRLYGRPSQWRVVVDNLISNAIKHSPKGSTIVICAAVVNGHCQLSVRDHGTGVAHEDKDRIFRPYVRGGQAVDAGVPGTGVGLSVVKETVQAHGGTTEIEDANPGARFKLEWPCDQPLH